MGKFMEAFKKNQAKRAMNDEGALSIGGLIGALILTVVGLYLTPTVQVAANSTITAVGGTSAAGAMAGLIPMLYVIVIFAGLAAYVYTGVKGN